MPQANRVDPRAKLLKDHFALLNHSPRRAKESPLANEINLKRLAAVLHIAPDRLAATADEQVRQVGKALTLSLFIGGCKEEVKERGFLQGLLFFWHSYLVPVAPVHPAPPIAKVIAYCAEPTNLREFLLDAQRWVGTALAGDPQTLRAALGILTPENLRKIVLGGLSAKPTESERRTYSNYLNAAALELARRLESLVPEFFRENESAAIAQSFEERKELLQFVPVVPEGQIQVQPPRQLELVARRVAQTCSRTTGVGWLSIPVECFHERPMLSRELRGQPQAPSLVNGTDANVTRMSGFLAGVLGSGRSAFLRHLAHQYARVFLQNPNGPLAFYLNAADFVIYARNRRSIHEFIGQSIAATEESVEGAEELPDYLRQLDQAGKLLVLVDDLDRLPSADQSEVLSQLTFSPAVVFAVLPWQVELLSKMTVRAHLGEFSFPPLDADSQMALLDRVARAADAVFNWQTLKRLCFELPYLSQELLGLVTILEQAQHPWTDMTRTLEVALEEYARRADFAMPPFGSESAKPMQEWQHLACGAFTLNHTLREQGGYERLNGQPDLVVTRAMIENPNGYHWQMTWEQVLHTGLFRPVTSNQGEGLALVNLDLALYLIAQQALKSHWTFDLPPHPIHPKAAELLQRAGWHLENLKHPNRDLPPKTYVSPPVVPEPKPWFARIPEIFRVLS